MLRAGIIGLDTSHAVEFTKLLNDPKAADDLAGVRVVAAFPGNSDIPTARERRPKFTEQVKAMGVEIVDSIPGAARQGRCRLARERRWPAAPGAGSAGLQGGQADVHRQAARRLARRRPGHRRTGRADQDAWFSSSALRFARDTQAARTDPKIGAITGCDAWSPCHLEPTHPDLFWYGIHGVETLYTIMGTGCESVSALALRRHRFRCRRLEGRPDRHVPRHPRRQARVRRRRCSARTASRRPGILRATARWSSRSSSSSRPAKPPVPAAETLEMMTFMEAADESRRQGGAPVKLADVLAKAREAGR